MTPTFSVTGSRRHIFVPASAESLPQGAAQYQDPPIYRALMRTWADRGRTRAWVLEQSGRADGMRRKAVAVAEARRGYLPYRYRNIA